MPSLAQLVLQAREETHTWTHPDLAKLLGCSLRTVQRHTHSGGLSQESHYGILIQAVYPRNPELARQLAAARGTTVAALGIASPVDPTQREHADSILCAAADALQLPPSAVRPALAAAFARAGEMNVTFAGLARHLRDGDPKAKAKAKPG
jgi:hypothetical protein